MHAPLKGKGKDKAVVQPHALFSNGDSSIFTSSSPANGLMRHHHSVQPNMNYDNHNFGNGFEKYVTPDYNGFAGPEASRQPSTGQTEETHPPSSWVQSSSDSPAIEVQTSSGSPSLGASPGQASFAASPKIGQKRQRESVTIPSNSNIHDSSKSRRTSPSPLVTRSATPASLDSFGELADDPDWFRLMGGDPRDQLRNLRAEQKEAEQAILARKQQEERDEDLARQLSDEYHNVLPSLSPSHRLFGTPTEQPYNMSQTYLDPTGTFRLPGQPAVSGYEKPQSTEYSPLRSEDYRIATSSLPRAKQERFQPAAAMSPSTPHIDLASDNDIDDGSSDNPVEIDRSSFVPSARKSRSALSTPGQWHLPMPHNSDNTTNWLSGATSMEPGPSGRINALQGSRRNPHQESSKYGYSDGYGLDFDSSSSLLDNQQSWQSPLIEADTGVLDSPKDYSDAAYNSFNLFNSSQATSGASLSNGYNVSPYSGPNNMASSATPFPANALIKNEPTSPQIQPDAMARLLQNNPFSATDPLSAAAYQQYIDSVRGLYDEPGKTAEEIKSLLENIRPDEELDPRTRIGSPDAMHADATLYEHQKLGLKWMIDMEEGSNKGGILADDMGLGKTLQAIALMVSKRSADPNRKTTLIVAPVALLRQWEREIEVKLRPEPEHRLTTYLYHSSSKGRHVTWEILKKHDVVLTTYGTLGAEYNRKLSIDNHRMANPNWLPRTSKDRLPLLGDECNWYRIILDEAQNIKNKNTKCAKSVYELKALTRFCMSGTPMMNSVMELFSLICFLRIKPYCNADKFTSDFVRPLKSHSDSGRAQAMSKLQAFLKAVLLRRTKKSTIDGKPILTLPERTTNVQPALFDDEEASFYKALETKTQLRFNKYFKEGTVGKNYSNVLVLLLRLRQACCHPRLITDNSVAASGVGIRLEEEMLALAKGLPFDVVARIKDAGAIECPICMDSAENATIFTPCGHSTCSECFARINDPAQATADDDGGEMGSKSVKCPSCRGAVDPKKVTDYASFMRVHMPDEMEDPGDPGLRAAESDSDSDYDSDFSDDSDDSDLGGFIVPDDVSNAEDLENGDVPATDSKGANPAKRNKSSHKKTKKSKGKRRLEVNPTNLTLEQLKAESHKNVRARRRYLKRLSKDWISSCKIEKTIEILQAIQDRGEGEKTIIFSQFTALLDLLEVPINDRKWKYRRYDGKMTSKQRNDAVVDFTEKPECQIMLVSLKAGNAGLNLTAASQVILFDPFWNPYVEEQAIDRAHRIGQRRPVQVHRLLIADTVEDRIIQLQEEKRALVDGALDENASAKIGRLGVRELAFLFGICS